MGVQGHDDLVSSLAARCTPELMDAVNCDTCGGNKPTLRWEKFSAVPPVLIMSLNRFVFDMQVLDRVRLNSRIELPLSVDLRPFLPGGAISTLQEQLGVAQFLVE